MNPFHRQSTSPSWLFVVRLSSPTNTTSALTSSAHHTRTIGIPAIWSRRHAETKIPNRCARVSRNERNENPNAVDINHASSTDLIALGLSHADTQRIIKSRPYTSKQELSDRGIVSPATYRGIADHITAK